MNDYSYPELGASRTGELPAGYNHLRQSAVIGHGRPALEAAGAALLDWRMHRLAGVRIDATADRAAPGVAVRCAIGLGPQRAGAPNQVPATADGPDRYGFTYGTRTGHPARGEETFLVELTRTAGSGSPSPPSADRSPGTPASPAHCSRSPNAPSPATADAYRPASRPGPAERQQADTPPAPSAGHPYRPGRPGRPDHLVHHFRPSGGAVDRRAGAGCVEA